MNISDKPPHESIKTFEQHLRGLSKLSLFQARFLYKYIFLPYLGFTQFRGLGNTATGFEQKQLVSIPLVTKPLN